MPMKNPPHPGKVVRVSCLEPFRLNETDAATGSSKLVARKASLTSST